MKLLAFNTRMSTYKKENPGQCRIKCTDRGLL